jgi:dipeptide/tripeptide permease
MMFKLYIGFLDKAAVETGNDKSTIGSNNPWRLCTVTQVEELKAVIRILPIWASGIIFATVYSQMSTLFVEQGDTMDADAMRSLMSAVSLTTVALGNYLSTLLVTIVTQITTRHGKKGWIPDNLNYGHIDYFFWLLAILSSLNFLVYLFIARWYTYKRPTGVFHVSK